MADKNEVEIDHVEKLNTIWSELTGDVFELSDSGKNSLRNFLKYLPPSDVYEIMIMASERIPENTEDGVNQRFRYFCGVCWNTIKGGSRAIIKVKK